MKTIDEKFDELKEQNPEALTADGFDEAYLGYTTGQFSPGATAVYSRPKCIEVLMTRDGMTHEEAEEFFSFNVEGAYVGKFTPLYVETE